MAERAVLKRLSMRLLKDNGSGAQVPAQGAEVFFFRQGATVKETTTLSGATEVPVYNLGALAVGDVVQVGTDGATTLSVDDVERDDPWVPGTSKVTLSLLTGSLAELAAATRLVRIKKAGTPNPVPDPALIHGDPLGTTSGAPSATADADGWVEGYVMDYRYDCVVTGADLDEPLVDQVGSFVLW